MKGAQFLLLPGPTPIPDQVVKAMSSPMVNHRGEEFKEILMEVTEGVKSVFQTKQNLVIYPASGSGAMEAAVVNFISPGDRVLVVSIGVFGDRFAEIAASFGAVVEKIDFPWGQAADYRVLEEKIRQDKNKTIKAVLVTHNDTSTGVVNDIKAIREAVGDHPALFIVDTVSGLAAHEFLMDEWNIDIAVSGSQKAFMIPPGISFMAFTDKALKIHREKHNSRFYWNVSVALEYLNKGQTPFTPAISLFYGLQEALKMIKSEGLDNTIKRHHGYRDLVRTAINAMGLGLLAREEDASCSVTAVIAPREIGSNIIRGEMQEEFNIILAGGQQRMDNVIFRIGHMGNVRNLDLLSICAALEIILVKRGYNLEIGRGVKKAQQVLLEKLRIG